MPLKQKQRSYAHESSLVKKGLTLGYGRSERAWASQGKALGEDERVDVLWEGHPRLPDLRIQSKRMMRYPDWLRAYIAALDGADVVVMRQDRDQDLALLPLDRLIGLLDDLASAAQQRLSSPEGGDAQVPEAEARPLEVGPRPSPALRSRKVFLGRPRPPRPPAGVDAGRDGLRGEAGADAPRRGRR